LVDIAAAGAIFLFIFEGESPKSVLRWLDSPERKKQQTTSNNYKLSPASPVLVPIR